MAPMTIPGSEASLFFYPNNPLPNSGSGVITKEKRQGTVNCSEVVWEEKTCIQFFAYLFSWGTHK